MLSWLLWIAAPALFAVPGTFDQKGGAVCEGIEIVSTELTVREAEKYCRYAVNERKKVEQFWGATWRAPIRIHVSSSFEIARSLLPNQGNPGYTEMPLARVKDNRGGLLHEITHSYAPNANRFLQEGLAVYLQDRIGGNISFPNFGRNLHTLARSGLSASDLLEELNNIRFPRRLATARVPERTAYVLAGSFVGFLIDTYGLPQFRTLYDTASYDHSYQKPLPALDREWRARIRRR